MHNPRSPTLIHPDQALAGECLILRFSHYPDEKTVEYRRAIVRLLDDASTFVALEPGKVVGRVEVVVGPEEWKGLVSLVLTDKRVGAWVVRLDGERVPVGVSDIVSNRHVALPLTR